MATPQKPQLGTAPFTQPVSKVTPGQVASGIGKVAGALGSLIKAPAQKPQYQAPLPGSIPGSNIPRAGVQPASVGIQAKSPEQNVKPPVTTIQSTQAKTQPTQPTGTNTQLPQSQPNAGSGSLFNQNASLQAPGQMTDPNKPTQVAQSSTQPAAQQGQPSPYQVGPGLYGQLIASMANRSNQPGQPYTDATKQYQDIADEILQSQKNQAGAEAQNRLNPIPIGDQTGREAVIRNQYGQQQQALGSRLGAASNVIGAANTQQGLMQGLLQQAAAGSAPQTMSPGQYQMSPLSGGAPTAAAGQQQGIDSATNWGIAQQNLSQGQQYQGQAQQISNSLQLLQALRPQLTNFMQNAGLNPNGVPIVNTQINKIDQQANPQAYATSRALLAEAQSFVQAMLQAQGGMTPTDAGTLVSSYDFSQLTPEQLGTFLQNMETAGNYRLSQAQSASQAGYGANSNIGAPAQGANPQIGTLQGGGANALNGIPDWLKALGGLGISTAAGAAGATSNAVAGAVGGASGGLAAKVLGLAK